jgi:hypothetical protein
MKRREFITLLDGAAVGTCYFVPNICLSARDVRQF